MTALREIRILQLLKHDNIVNLVEICRTKGEWLFVHCVLTLPLMTGCLLTIPATPYNREKGSIYLVFDFYEHDLAGLLNCNEVKFSLPEIKAVMQQLFNALFFIHGSRILHRDMKSSNIMITKNGVLKLGDFGLARAMSKGQAQQRYTNRVVTLWYRPPELILGERNYGPPIDMWGAGCIMCEMWTRRPVMQGESEQHQISLISQLCGTISPDVWPSVDKLEFYSKLELPKGHRRIIKERLRHYVKDQYAVDLIDKLLILDPRKRLDSDNALNHDIFWEDPMPSTTELAHTLARFKSSMFVMHSNRRPVQPPAATGGVGVAVQSTSVAGNVHDRVF